MNGKYGVPARDFVQSMAKIADLAESHYRTTLALSALVELLVERGVLTPEEFHRKASALEREDEAALGAAGAAARHGSSEPTSSQSVGRS